MELYHYSLYPVEKVQSSSQETTPDFKPHGFWVSDDTCDQNWRSWCESESFRLDSLRFRHRVILTPNANLCLIRNSSELDEFTREYKKEVIPGHRSIWNISWKRVAERYDAIIITPYISSRRLTAHTSWYYGWDCASGCIWNARAVKSIKVVETV